MHHVHTSRNVSRQFNHRAIAREHFQAVVKSAGAAKSRMVYGAIAAIIIGVGSAVFTVGLGFLVGVTLLTINAGLYIGSRLAGGIAAAKLAEMEG